MESFEPTEEHGSITLHPPRLDDWVAAARDNRTDLRHASFFGISVQEARRELGIPSDRAVILSGHQPILFHPGIYAKLAAASVLAARSEGAAYHKVTDTDAPKEWEFRFPEVTLEETPHPFFDGVETRVPYADQKPPSERRMSAVLDRFTHGRVADLKDGISAHREHLLEQARSSNHWNDFHVRTVRHLDRICGLDRGFLIANQLFESNIFQRYWTAWFKDLRTLSGHYNRSLADHRRTFHLRNNAVPFPDLQMDGEWMESPFWAAIPHQERQTLWVKNDGPQSALLRVEGDPKTWKVSWEGGTPKIEVPFRIWPKALPQTLFTRLFLCDYFVHGLGGAKYERVNDRFILAIHQGKPPSYGMASATFYIDEASLIQWEQATARMETILRWERLLAQNPEYSVTRSQQWKAELPAPFTASLHEVADTPEFKELVEKKRQLLGELDDPTRRPEAGRHIREVNDALREHLQPLGLEFQHLKQEYKSIQAEGKVLTWRGYPYFCFPDTTITSLNDRIFAS